MVIDRFELQRGMLDLELAMQIAGRLIQEGAITVINISHQMRRQGRFRRTHGPDMEIVHFSYMRKAGEIPAHFRNLKAYHPDVTVQVTGGLNRPPYEMSAGGAKLYAHAQKVASEIGIDLVGVTTGGGSDGNFTAPFVATLDGLGIDGNGAHTMHEHMLISSIEPRMNLQKRLFETLV